MNQLIRCTALMCSVSFSPFLGTAIAAEEMPSVKTVVISSSTPFSEASIVPGNIKSECDLPGQQAKWLAEGLRAQGFNVLIQDQPQQSQTDAVLEVQIASAYSGGNAFIGHSKGVALSGKLTRNNQQLGSFVAFRKSGGGLMAGFKGSCSVLYRCTKTLGEDVAKWLKAPSDHAQLGNAQ